MFEFLRRKRKATLGNVLMVHIGRCGSTVLGKLLEQHSKIHWAGEIYAPIFHKWIKENGGQEQPGQMPRDAIELLKRSMRSASNRFYGFEIKPFHFRLIQYEPQAFMDQLQVLGFDRVIVLDRRNRLRKIVSSMIAHERASAYHAATGTDATLNQINVDLNEVRIDFDQQSLVGHLAQYDQQMKLVDDLIVGRKVLRLSYEADIQTNPSHAYEQVCDFLDLQTEPAEVKLAATNPFPLTEIIRNIEEVRTALETTPYAWMLEESQR